MSAGGRFVVDAWGPERRGVATGEGRDLRTGLPVRVRRFAGPPRGDPERLDHPNLPGVLAVERGASETRFVTLEPRGYVSLHERPNGLAAAATVAAADALAELHAAGVVHGDLGPHRLLLGPDGHLLLDGGGVPWRDTDGPEPRREDDVRALAGALAAAGDELRAPVADVLDRTVRGRGAPRDAAGLRDALREAAEAPLDAPDDVPVVKDLPPGGVYKSGETHPAPQPAAYGGAPAGAPARRPARVPWRAVTFVAVVAAVGAAGVLLQDRWAAPPPAPADGTSASRQAYVVEVGVLPAGAPPLRVWVLEAPADSDLTEGTGLGQAPDRLVFDAQGRWVIEGRFGARRSRPVTFELPGATEVTLRLPPADDASR